MKLTCLAAIGLLATGSAWAQQTGSEIKREQKFLGSVYVQNGHTLKIKDLTQSLSTNPESEHLFKQAKTNYYAGQIIGGAGGFLVGFTLGNAVAGGDPTWALAAVGAGLIGVSVPFSMAFVRKTDEAVEVYNALLKPTSHRSRKPEFYMSFSATGAGLTMQF